MTLIDTKRPAQWSETNNPADCAEWLGLNPMDGYLSWDMFDAVFTPGDIILLISRPDQKAAEEFEGSVSLQDGARLRRVRVIRDYGMCDRREAKTPEQVLLAWAVQRGAAVLTTPKTAARARENFDISPLPQDAFEEINGIQTRERYNRVVETGSPGFIPRGR